MKIILIGFMGSGKTTVANILARKLDLEVIEMDQLILTKSGNKSISEVFSLNGEKHFRDLETETAEEVSGMNNVVVSTGGGIVMKKRNLKHLKKGIIFFLNTSFKVLEKRLFGDDTRPLFKNKIKAKRLFDLRKNIYKKWADHTILTDKQSISQVVNNLIKLL